MIHPCSVTSCKQSSNVRCAEMDRTYGENEWGKIVKEDLCVICGGDKEKRKTKLEMDGWGERVIECQGPEHAGGCTRDEMNWSDTVYRG